MLIHHTTNDHPRRPAHDDIWLDDDDDDDDEDEDADEEQDMDLTEAGLVSQLGLRKGLPDDSYS